MKAPPLAPQLNDLIQRIPNQRLAAVLLARGLADGEYFHWEEIRHRRPPAELTTEEWWLGIKLARSHFLRPVPLRDKKGDPFQYGVPDLVLRMLHEVDKEASGGIQMPEQVTNPGTRDRYIINSLIEEAITSSQLEGASTTVEVAKDMIRSGRQPVDRSEQMIFNNYSAMRYVQRNAHEVLTPEMVFELHRIVTENAIDNPAHAGWFRSASDNVIVEDGFGNLLHVPPAAAELPERLGAMCAFANEQSSTQFLHPVVRAIVLHFWLAYDHPFVDGNGRTARALFYWAMLSQNYWLTEYISISQILKKAPGQYSRSFLYTETDGNDLTYFITYQLQVIQRAIDELQKYLRKKMSEVRELESMLRRSADLNHRQLAVLSHALKHPGARYTVQSHQLSHNVVYETARTDLLELAERKFLTRRKAKQAYVFAPAPDLAARIGGGG